VRCSLISRKPLLTAAFSLLVAGVVLAQDQNGLIVENPLDEIRRSLLSVLEESGVPFSEAQVRDIALRMDEQKRATEELFGQIFDFSDGPPQGAQLDRARAGIAFMSEAFLADIDEILTPAQGEAWREARMNGDVPENARLGGEQGGAGSSQQISQIRINNNPFTAETLAGGFGGGFGGGGGGGGNTEVITRGGVGAYHGNVDFTFQDDALNARNVFAPNKPEYFQRNLNMGFNGPLVPNRLSASLTVRHNVQENVDTISAITPGGLVSEGITRPATGKGLFGNAQLQVSDRQALHFTASFNSNHNENQGIGGITLRERARTFESANTRVGVRSLTQLSDPTLLDVSLNYFRNTDENKRVTGGAALDVVDAFNGGGATNNNEGLSQTLRLNSLLIRTGQRVTLKAGFDVSHLRDRSLTEDNFNGTFEFDSLADYMAGTPSRYTVMMGNPLLEMSQTESAVFAQGDFRLSRRTALMFGLRYEAQSNIDDTDNLDPRFGFAYSIDDSTVLRGGIGLFHNRLFSNTVQGLMRLDGTRQQQIVLTAPGYPDPFASGSGGVVPPSSIRVRSPGLENSSNLMSQLSLEKTFPGNVQVTTTWDFNRSRNQYRSVNLNAPPPGQTVRPDPAQGNILELRSTGRAETHTLRFTAQQRLRILTVSGSYRWVHQMNDSQGPFSLPMNNYDLGADWARGNSRVHNFNASVNAQLPLGVFMTLGVSAQSGQPYTITTGTDDNADTNRNDRPAGVPRNSETGPGFNSISLNLSKAFFLRRSTVGGGAGGGGTQVNIFANATNLLNRGNYQNVSSALTSTRFGQPTSADDPREIEIGMRFRF
jgi:hypothetical protein